MAKYLVRAQQLLHIEALVFAESLEEAANIVRDSAYGPGENGSVTEEEVEILEVMEAP